MKYLYIIQLDFQFADILFEKSCPTHKIEYEYPTTFVQCNFSYAVGFF